MGNPLLGGLIQLVSCGAQDRYLPNPTYHAGDYLRFIDIIRDFEAAIIDGGKVYYEILRYIWETKEQEKQTLVRQKFALITGTAWKELPSLVWRYMPCNPYDRFETMNYPGEYDTAKDLAQQAFDDESTEDAFRRLFFNAKVLFSASRIGDIIEYCGKLEVNAYTKILLSDILKYYAGRPMHKEVNRGHLRTPQIRANVKKTQRNIKRYDDQWEAKYNDKLIAAEDIFPRYSHY